MQLAMQNHAEMAYHWRQPGPGVLDKVDSDFEYQHVDQIYSVAYFAQELEYRAVYDASPFRCSD
jgi:hypothetical protein